MKKVLVVYYTQTGQMSKALNATLEPLKADTDIELYYELVKPKKDYPFPWPYTTFFDTFPECVHGNPCELEPFALDTSLKYDLVILAYQPWFLSICVPINSFLQSKEAVNVLKNTPVVTVIACRNMWLNAQEKMKKRLLELNAHLTGNITFVDKSANLVSLITVLAFVLGGVKDRFMGIFPKYGVSDKDLQEMAPECGKLIRSALRNTDFKDLQNELNKVGAVNIKPNLMLLEGRGRVLFPLYANYISRKGVAGSEERRTRVRIFGIVLPTAILILSPIITILSRLAPLLFSSKFRQEMNYYTQNTLKTR